MKSNIKIFSRMLAVVMLLATFTASAWIYQPTNQTDINLVAYYQSLYPAPAGTVVSIGFYNETEHLAFVLVDKGSGGIKYYFHSNQTRIGSSSTAPAPVHIKYSLMCPDGHSATVKRHIALIKSIYTPNSYGLRADGTVCGSSSTPPPNQTSISTIQALYGSNFTVVRMLSSRDLFKVTCTSYPFCYMDDDSISWGVTYHSNTQKIAHRARLISWTFVAVRTKDTVTDQTAKDDIDILVGGNLESQPWQWVDYSWEERWRSWFN